MKQATHYKIAYSYKCFSVYEENSLIGKIEKPLFGRWPIRLEVNGTNYLLERNSIFNSVITIQIRNTDEPAGRIYVPGFLGLFSKVTYEYEAGKQITWLVKDFFSLHWQWENNKHICMDTVETVQHRRPTQAIAITEDDTNNNLLILTGIFLSLLRKSRLSFGIFWF